jgi:hypothetical protein
MWSSCIIMSFCGFCFHSTVIFFFLVKYLTTHNSCLCGLHKIEQSLQLVTLNNQQLCNVLHYYICITEGILTILLAHDRINHVIEFHPVRYKYGFHQYGFLVILSSFWVALECQLHRRHSILQFLHIVTLNFYRSLLWRKWNM